MDLQVLVLTADAQLGELVKAQVDNLGCACDVVTGYETVAARLDWADGLVVDLMGSGLSDLRRLRSVDAGLPIVAIAPDASTAVSAQAVGVHHVLVEPFSIADVVDAVKAMAPFDPTTVIDLDAEANGAAPTDDKPWWATR